MKTILVRLNLVVILALANLTFVHASGPNIQSIEPLEGTVGQTIKLTGTNLLKTQSIEFLVGRTFRRAKFQIVSKTQLELIVPDFLRPNAEALILLFGDDSVSITCPVSETVIRDDQPPINQNHSNSTQVFHILQGGVLRHSSMTAIVEKHGLISQVKNSPLVLVKAGGSIGKCEARGPLTVLYETGAKLSLDVMAENPRWTVAGVSEIHVAEGVGPFVFQPLPKDHQLARSRVRPEIHSIDPAIVSPGATVTVKGIGFSGTSEVYAATRTLNPAGFHVVSDDLLKMEIPENVITDFCELIVVNSKGLTVTRSAAADVISNQTAGQSSNRHFVEVTTGTVLTSSTVDPAARDAIFLVNGGGTIASPQFTGVFLVKFGGRIVTPAGQCFHEQGAKIPVTLKSKQVESISVSHLPASLRISPLLPWKP